ncbi:ester cyclase [Sphingomonas sp.]|uniref:ester cyclase n=1 Tax=Sphingomonas sp. TaxID=28214 RepID=UPI001B16EB50|nr:ester cyclase [Sphingomonas sp.]MBO9714384.1 ester cyclase [Sphingomonas sp.]
MTLSREAMDRKMDQHFGYEARDDIVGWPLGPSHGREGARPFYEALFGDLKDGEVRCLRRLYGEDFLVDDSLWRGHAPGRPFGIEGQGRPLEFRLLHVVEFDGGGDIRRENVWVDLAAIQAQLT